MRRSIALHQVLRCGSDHRLDQALLPDLADRRTQHALAVAQHGQAITDLIDLFQVMGDVEDADPAAFEPADPFKQALDGGLLQRGGRLVQDQEARADREGARDLDHLALLDGEGLCETVNIQVEAPVEHDLPRVRAHGTPVDDAVVIADGAIEKDVFGDGEGGHDHRFLIDAGHQTLPCCSIG